MALLLLVGGALLFRWANAAENLVDGACVQDYDASRDYFPSKAYPEFAALFDVTYFDSYKIVENLNSGDRLVLWQCGTPKPDVADATAYFEVPLTKIALTGTTYIPRVEQLGERTKIVAYTTETEYITSPCVLEMLGDGAITAASYSVDAYTSCANNTELEYLGVEAVFGTSTYRYCTDNSSTALYNGVAVADVLEAGKEANLQFADWIKFFAYFFNREAEATAAFEAVFNRFSCTENNAMACSIQNDDVRAVAWVPFFYDGVGWAVPERHTYYDEAITSAGGDLLICAGSETTSYSSFKESYMTDSEFLDCYRDADVCIFGGDFSYIYSDTADSSGAGKKALLDKLTCIKDKAAFDQSRNGPNDWFESRIAEPDLLLQDLVLALHGDDTTTYGISSGRRVWLRNVFEDKIGGSDNKCEDVSAPLELKGAACTDTVLEFCAGTAVAPNGVAAAAAVLAGAVLAFAAATH